MKKSTEALDVLKIPEKSDCKMGRNVKKYKSGIICINTFVENDYIIN